MDKSKDVLEFMATQAYRPLTQEELIKHFSIEAPQEIKEFSMTLNEMELKGQIILTRKMRYGLPKQMNLVVGRIQRHAKGFAFLIPDDANQRDVYIKSDDLSGAMHNDRVVVRLHNQSDIKKKQEGEVIRVLVRTNKTLVGTFDSSRQFGFVIPDDSRIGQDFFVGKEDFNGAKSGDKVVIEVTRWPEKRRSPEGKVIEVIGKKGDPGVDVVSIVRKFQLPEDFPKDVLEAADKVPLSISPDELKNRRDLRTLPMVTIDGEDAKDLDDAVTLEILDSGLYRLGVHIADVGHYVPEGSTLDKEALKRATSVYLVDRVIPMLPKRLSNGICSLNAGEDRLAMTCFMDINKKGEIVDHEICESVIHVNERMTYKNVTKILEEEDKELIERYKDFVNTFKQMSELCLILKNKRLVRGSIDFDFPESKVILDEQGKPIEIAWRERTLADQIIEEFMICANETVAEHYYWTETPFLYRVHEEPDQEDLGDLNNFLGIFGLHIKGITEKVHPKAFQQIVEKVVGSPEERVITTVMLRSMKHARYAADALGHFGLASKYYSHFTSPIRRYPDLAIHRVIKEMLRKGEKLEGKRLEQLKAKMGEYAQQSSLQERVAEEAERESVDLKKVEYMKQFEGQAFKGVVSSVTSFGLFVELENSAEGLVHVSTMTDDFYQYVEKKLTLLGENTKKAYQLGQAVKVLITRVNTEDRQIDLELVEEE
ncbi:MAG: ribonuclease R [Clostridiaceae bacterium BRH_c20a]|nr:MAG: ribonuclease R [Clostridiaceae bacterium BRH_c20a]